MVPGCRLTVDTAAGSSRIARMLRVKGMSSDVSFVLLRVVSGLMFSFHGLYRRTGEYAQGWFR
jgi:hypothetical protein